MSCHFISTFQHSPTPCSTSISFIVKEFYSWKDNHDSHCNFNVYSPPLYLYMSIHVNVLTLALVQSMSTSHPLPLPTFLHPWFIFTMYVGAHNFIPWRNSPCQSGHNFTFRQRRLSQQDTCKVFSMFKWIWNCFNQLRILQEWCCYITHNLLSCSFLNGGLFEVRIIL
jgi:hypothetical protein